MRIAIPKLMLCIAATLFVFSAMASSARAQAKKDPFMGTWELNVDKSKYTPGPAVKSLTVKREAAGTGVVKVTVDGVNGQGNKTHLEYTDKHDGKDNPVTGSQTFDSMALLRIDSHTTIVVYKKGGNVVRIVRQVVSKDGKSFTGDDFGAYENSPAFHNLTVFEKQ